MKKKKICRFLLNPIVVCIACVANLDAAMFELIGYEPGKLRSTAYSISPNGQFIAGTIADGENGTRPFVWSESDGILEVPSSFDHFPNETMDVSDTGILVSDNFDDAYRWSKSAGVVSLGTLGGSERQAFAGGISADGSVIVGQSTSAPNSLQAAYRWTEAGMIELGVGELEPFAGSNATAVSADGTTIVGWGELNGMFGTDGWRWRAESGFEELGGLTDRGLALPWATSDDGEVVVGEANTQEFSREAFRWTKGQGMESLGLAPGGLSAAARGVSGDGTVIVGEVTIDGLGFRAFIWDEDNQMRDLNDVLVDDYEIDLEDWSLEYAWDVSSDGTVIVGLAMKENADTAAFRVFLPEPSSANLLLIAIGFLAMHRRSVKGVQ